MHNAFENRAVSPRDVHDLPAASAPAQPDPLLGLFDRGRRVELAAGEWLVRRGDAGRELFLVERGSLDAVVEGSDGQEQTLARFGAGALIGEISYLLGGARSASVRARERTVVLARAWNEAEAATDGRSGFALAGLLAQRLRSTNALLADLLREEEGDSSPGAAASVRLAADTDRSTVIERSELRLDDLRALVEGRVLALRVPGWYTGRQSQQLCRRLLRHPGFSRYSIAPDVGVQRVGYSFFETRGEEEALAAYFDLAVPTIRELRRVCAPLLIPMDRLRLELDELWPGGAGLASLGGRKMFVGTSRLFEDGHSLPPHQDLLARETGDAAAQRMTAQLTANVYLRPPRGGGELEVWSLRPNDEEVRQYYTGEYDFFDLAKLPPPAAVIRPGVGELVLMLSDRIHAVRPSEGGPRVSMSCFIGHSGEQDRLVLWN